MRDIWYLVLPLIISALITPVVKQIGYRLDAFAQMNERTVHHGKIVRIGDDVILVDIAVEECRCACKEKDKENKKKKRGFFC